MGVQSDVNVDGDTPDSGLRCRLSPPLLPRRSSRGGTRRPAPPAGTRDTTGLNWSGTSSRSASLVSAMAVCVSTSLRGLGAAEVDDVHELLRLHGLQDALVGGGASESEERAEVEEVAPRGSELGGRGPSPGQEQRAA